MTDTLPGHWALVMVWDGSNGLPTGHDEVLCVSREAAIDRWYFEQLHMRPADKAAVTHYIEHRPYRGCHFRCGCR